MDISSHRGRKGLQINPSSSLKIYCTLPASMVIIVPLLPTPAPPYTPDETNSTAASVANSPVTDGAESASNGDSVSPEKEIDSTRETIQRTKSTGSDIGATSPVSDASVVNPPSPPAKGSGSVVSIPQSSFQWIGDSSGDISEALTEFLQSLPPDATSFRICFSCVDRMTRDTLALSCRTLVGFDAGPRRRC